MTDAIDQFLDHGLWQDTHRARLVPVGESASLRRHAPGELLFEQFHPADRFSLLLGGSVGHETSEDEQAEAWPMGRVSWPWAALGWSGFLPPFRNGTTARAITAVELLSWSHEDLARIFYQDPALAVDFLRLVVDSVRRQFEWVRGERLAQRSSRPPHSPKSLTEGEPDRHRFAPSLLSALRQSAFFEQFDDELLEQLTADAQLVRRERNSELVAQSDRLDGLWVLAAGDAISYFMSVDADGERLERFRSIPTGGGILAGIPTLDRGFRAEATVVSASTCWLYVIPAATIARLSESDPEFGRLLMQRHLMRLAHLITAARLPRPRPNEEPEIVAVKSILNQNQARIPVTSELHKLPHLLSHRLTIDNALSCLDSVRETGDYGERAIARSCADQLDGLRSELHFYRDVLEAYRLVTSAPAEADAVTLRRACDERLASAFGHLRTEVHGLKHLPPGSGHIVVMNHLACPPYYELPNHYHFSFDTAFVSVLLQAYYGHSPVRVVRQSPGAEYGHNLFYGRLGHITVPTLESGHDSARREDLARLRREASATLFEQGDAALRAGQNLLVCPEGQSQKVSSSPAKFYSGAFRLALRSEVEPLIVPVAVAGFDVRYKDSKLVAVVLQPFRLSDAMACLGTANLREFLEHLRNQFSLSVREAQRLSQSPTPIDSAVCSQRRLRPH